MTAEEFAAEYSAGYLATVNLLARWGAEPRGVEDLAQEAWTKAWAARETWRGEAKFRSWVALIARNCLRDVRRRKQDVLCPVTPEVAIPSHEQSVGDRLLSERLLRKLAPEMRTVVTDYYFGGLTTEEIAEQRHKNLNTVKVDLHRSRLLMRKAAAWKSLAA